MYVKRLVLDVINQEKLEIGSERIITDSESQFDIFIRKLSEPDQVIEATQTEVITTQALDQGIFGGEWMVDENGKRFTRNPKFIGFKAIPPPDWISGTANLIDAARQQLPQSGPGVVWIRIPDISWRNGVVEPLERVEILIQDKLTGQYNRRVNSAFVMRRIFETTEMDGIPCLACRPIVIRVDHDNPKMVMSENDES